MDSEALDYTYEKDYTANFDNALMAFGVFYALKNSQLDYDEGLFLIIKQFSLIVSLCFSMLSVLQNFKWTFYNKIAFGLLFFIPLYLRISYTSNILGSSMLILAAYNIPFSHIARQCIRVLVIAFVIVLGALAFDLIEDRLYHRDVDNFENSFAHDLGFKYYSYYAYLGMGIVQCCLYQWRHQLDLKKIVFLVLLSYIFFVYSSTRLQLYACIAFMVAIFVIPYIKSILNNRFLAWLAIVAYPLICILLYFVSKYFILSIFFSGYEDLNRITSGRLALNEEALMRYNVTLWGNDLEFDTSPTTKDYFYLDSGYLHVLLGDGLVFTVIVLFLYAVLTYKIFKAKAYFLYLWILIYAVLNISNGFLVALLENPILLLAFSDYESIEYDYNLDVPTYADDEYDIRE